MSALSEAMMYVRAGGSPTVREGVFSAMNHSKRNTQSVTSDFNYSDFPLAYLITIRCYGTWLHGDERGSVDRKYNRYGTPRIAPNS